MRKINTEGNEIINSALNETESFDLQRFWNLESVGIWENKTELFSQKDLNALVFLNYNLNFVNGRYETKLV